jgi:hypothetical protein
MVKRTDKIIADEQYKSNETKVSKIIDYASNPTAHSKNASKNDNLSPDELIGFLADAYENKRARQVFEWETIRRNAFRQAA